ncbi:MAG: hypothetical protein K2Y29_05995 [Beijerinckiaceae bacterium]|nr:hypothetical protein [Beijerinckiaceae bacterium]
MANASKTHIGKGAKGKGAGVGAMTTLPEGVLEENMVLSNRDKSQHPQERGLDSRTVRDEQHQDSAYNRRPEPDAQPGDEASTSDKET